MLRDLSEQFSVIAAKGDKNTKDDSGHMIKVPEANAGQRLDRAMNRRKHRLGSLLQLLHFFNAA